ncbi:hypothetical protein BD779DRAFT_1607812 [Infundibulicybe gibba]|nr:hypothetical protein BD779DRAFT_1607812 [Infundibulicybe gibba]
MANGNLALPNEKEVRRQASNRSLNPPAPISTSPNRSATAPAPRRDPEDAEADGSIYTTMTPIVESPTAIQPPQYPDTFLSATPRDTDSVSVISTATNGQPKDKKRPWRRATAARKPTGLASAIAASGLAMANPSFSSAQQAQFATPPPVPPLPPRANTARKMSGPGSRAPCRARPRHRQNTQNRARRMVPRRIKDTRNGFNGEDSNDEGDSSDLDIGEEDIPVTGFAVASNKRNADFHELFPSIPEADYLIEDYGCALQREILIQGRIYISENHICFHANIFGWITDLSIPIYEITCLEKRMTAFVIPNAIQITTRQAKYTFASFLSRDTTFDVIHNIWRLARPGDTASIESGVSDDAPRGLGVPQGMPSGLGAEKAVKKATQCACGKAGQHFSETALEAVMPGTPDRIHNLWFASGFIKDFMAVNQKLLDIQISDWTPTAPGSTLLARNMSYIKPLNGSLGPKQTKCEIRDETVHADFDDYVSTLTTTRTPDVPSGGVFAVKTRTCIMWASAVSSRIIVTTQVEWTGRSFIKGIIERSAIDGQKVYHADLDKAMRAYIQEHRSEFIPEGVDVAAIALEEAGAPPSAGLDGPNGTRSVGDGASSDELKKTREKERNQRGLQWAWDTFDGASQVARQSTRGALELIRDGWEQSSSTTILYFVIVLLVLSNVWTLMRIGSREEAGRRKEMKKIEEREKWVQGVVTAVWEELSSSGGRRMGYQRLRLGWWAKEMEALQGTLDAIEARVREIRGSIREVESLKNLD